MLAPWALVALAVAWNLVTLRAELLPVAYLNDSSVHEQMVRFATSQWSNGHLPLQRWFPYLGEGSPQFLHYQSLPAMLAGALGLLIGANTAFRLTLYLLLSLWPISVYLGARWFGFGRSAAAGAALLSPLIMGITGVGYEQHAYLWIGYGIWAQLWAMMTLPLAWGASWRAIHQGRGLFAASMLVALTVALHFETGYLALAPLLIWPLVARPEIARRILRTGVIVAGVALTAAWVIVPLIHMRQWAAVNEALQRGPLVNGYGAGSVLSWTFEGRLLDNARLPVLTVLAAVGLVLAVRRWRTEPAERAVIVALLLSLILSFGRATFGSLVDVVPGAADVFFRRFMMGAQLAGVLLAGSGAAFLATRAQALLESAARRVAGGRHRLQAGRRRTDIARLAAGPLCAAAALLILWPALAQIAHVDKTNSNEIGAQRLGEAQQSPQIEQLIDIIRRSGPGRTYAGRPDNWGAQFLVGTVPVFKYLESRDVDEVGYTLRTASLMNGPEFEFDELQPGDFSLFGIRYLILPENRRPPLFATRRACAGIYCLWIVPGGGYVHAGQLVGSYRANRTDLGRRSIALLRSALAQRGRLLAVDFPGRRASSSPAETQDHGSVPVRRAARAPAGSPYAVHQDAVDMTAGTATATALMRRPGVVFLSTSFDPGWEATIDGRHAHTFMVAPAEVGVAVPAGEHRVTFTYHGYRGYPYLLTLAGASILVLALAAPAVGRRWRRRPTEPGRLEDTSA